MRCVRALPLALLLASPVATRAAAPAEGAGEPEIKVTAPPAPECADRGKLDLACLNREIDAKAAGPTAPAVDAAVADGDRPANQVGTFTRAATAQRMGTNFGHSASPQRPPPPVFSNPIMGTGGVR